MTKYLAVMTNPKVAMIAVLKEDDVMTTIKASLTVILDAIMVTAMRSAPASSIAAMMFIMPRSIVTPVVAQPQPLLTRAMPQVIPMATAFSAKADTVTITLTSIIRIW